MLDRMSNEALVEMGKSLKEGGKVAEALLKVSAVQAFEAFDDLEPKERDGITKMVFARTFVDLCKAMAENADLKEELETLKKAE